MTTQRPAFARDDHRTWQWGEAPPGVREQMAWWHIAPVCLITPTVSQLNAANRGDLDGSASFTITGIYVRLHLPSNRLWFLEYKSVCSQRHGVTKTMRWFGEDDARTRWDSHWQKAMENSGGAAMVDTMYLCRPDSSFNYGSMKAQYRGIEFTPNTPNVGGPCIANFHDRLEPVAG